MALGTDDLVGGRWRLGAKLGAGAFGEVYLANDVETGEVVAVKFEKADVKHPQLYYENKIYKWLCASTNWPIVGIPRRRYYGNTSEYNMLVMDCLGPSLEDRLSQCRRRMSLKSVLMIGLQALRRVEFIHGKSFIHRDLKPDNILMGNGDEAGILFIVDFGLAKRYRDHHTHQHIPYREGKHLTGTARYASINTHKGYEQSRRDDLESLGYVLVYLAKGELPWQGLRAATKKQKYQKIRERKQRTNLHELCKDMPNQFLEYFRHVKGLGFEDRPDYSYLRGLFRKALDRRQLMDDGLFDWMDPAQGVRTSRRSITRRRSGQHSAALKWDSMSHNLTVELHVRTTTCNKGKESFFRKKRFLRRIPFRLEIESPSNRDIDISFLPLEGYGNYHFPLVQTVSGNDEKIQFVVIFTAEVTAPGQINCSIFAMQVNYEDEVDSVVSLGAVIVFLMVELNALSPWSATR